jgi:hypothetical protein
MHNRAQLKDEITTYVQWMTMIIPILANKIFISGSRIDPIDHKISL